MSTSLRDADIDAEVSSPVSLVPSPAAGVSSSADTVVPSARFRRWALVEDRDAARLVVWGPVGPADIASLDARLAALADGRVPLVVDLTGVTELHPDAVAWLGRRHEEFGAARPMLVTVVADGHLHRLLTAPEAPRLRLRLE